MGEATLPTPAEILAIHEEIESAYEMKYTGTRVAAPKLKLRQILRDCTENDGVYRRSRASASGLDPEAVHQRAAFLLRKLITTHLFEDGNKRTAWVSTREYLLRHGERPADCGPDSERVLSRIRRYDVEEIAQWLETGSLDEDRLQP